MIEYDQRALPLKRLLELLLHAETQLQAVGALLACCEQFKVCSQPSLGF